MRDGIFTSEHIHNIWGKRYISDGDRCGSDLYLITFPFSGQTNTT